jgi:hypothetical protein
MFFLRFTFLSLIMAISGNLYAQTCTAIVDGTIDFKDIIWQGDSLISSATCKAIAEGNDITTVADFFISTRNSSASKVMITNDVTINGDLILADGPTGTSMTLEISNSSTLLVTGDLGDPNNNRTTYIVVTTNDFILVGGTLYSNNLASFQGNGKILGVTLDIGNGGICATPCPVTQGFEYCISDNKNTFCDKYNVALPISLITFNGRALLDGIKLNWSTASEINFDFFELIKSNDGLNFNSIGEIKGNGTSNIRHDYSFKDEKPYIGRNYYRLKSVDFDGYSEVFSVIMVEFNGEKSFSVYPNPSEGHQVEIETNFVPSQATFIAIYSSTGSEIARYRVENDYATLKMPVKLESGWYYARYISSEFTSVSRFLVR